jgi:hypothetical protein
VERSSKLRRWTEEIKSIALLNVEKSIHIRCREKKEGRVEGRIMQTSLRFAYLAGQPTPTVSLYLVATEPTPLVQSCAEGE